MLHGLAVVACFYAVSATGPDCSKAACGKVCTCSEAKCSTEIDACMADSNCASLQTCAMGCACGDHTCATKCRLKSPAAAELAAPVFQCTMTNCGSETSTVASTAPGPDCTKAACGEVCACSEAKCSTEIGACMADSNCASLQTCAMGCACGDHMCTIQCALENPTAAKLVTPLLQCTKANCWSEPDPFVSIAAGPDCSNAACGKVCTCSEDKCSKEVQACLDDARCAALQDCAMACPCGDHMCTIKCALKNPFAAWTAKLLLACTKSNCWSQRGNTSLSMIV